MTTISSLLINGRRFGSFAASKALVSDLAVTADRSTTGSWRRSFASGAKRHGGYKKSNKQKSNNVQETNSKNGRNGSNNVSKTNPSSVMQSSATTRSGRSITFRDNLFWIHPIRYRFTPSGLGPRYTREQAVELAKRLPMWLVLAVLLLWDETTPYSFKGTRGPSMLPTIPADGSNIWLFSTWAWWRMLGFDPPYRIGDIVIFAHPDHPLHVACKRIVGLPGDRVQRYGQYVHLYVDQDPDGWGIMWPDTENDEDHVHQWIDRDCPWDEGKNTNSDSDQLIEMKRTLIVPEGHVWIEGDCPPFSIDSRHYGPIPVKWLCGKIVTRVWPFWDTKPMSERHALNERPHPIPLDPETLMEYNVFHDKKEQSNNSIA